MMLHSVYFWLVDGLTDADREAFEKGMQALAAIDVVASAKIGKPAGTPDREGVTQNTFDYALFLEFETVEDHNTYQAHPDHLVFVDNFKKWFGTVKVYDTGIL